MTAPVPRDARQHPRLLVAEACAVYGTGEVARWCTELLARRLAYDDPSAPPLVWIGGAAALAQLRIGRLAERGQDFWPRVWAARGLRYAWVPEAAGAVVQALADPAWRVRETAAKVVRLREIGEAADALAGLAADPVPRVRAAAVRALGAVGEAEHAEAVRQAAADPEPTVGRAAGAALAELCRRLDREL